MSRYSGKTDQLTTGKDSRNKVTVEVNNDDKLTAKGNGFIET